MNYDVFRGDINEKVLVQLTSEGKIKKNFQQFSRQVEHGDCNDNTKLRFYEVCSVLRRIVEVCDPAA